MERPVERETHCGWEYVKRAFALSTLFEMLDNPRLYLGHLRYIPLRDVYDSRVPVFLCSCVLAMKNHHRFKLKLGS